MDPEDETNDSFDYETDNVEPSLDDDPELDDELDPEDNLDDEQDETDEGTEEDETDEVEADDEAEDQEAEEPQEQELGDDVLVKMPDGSTVSLKELKESPMLKADHTRKTQEVAEQRKTVVADAERVSNIVETFAEHLLALIPAHPDASLALTDPGKFTAQKAQHDAAQAQVNQLIELGSQPKEILDKISKEDKEKAIQDEFQKLVAADPKAADPKYRKALFTDVREVGHSVGFTDKELAENIDHRFFLLAKLAKEGMASQKAKKTAKAKVEKAPPVAVKKPGQGVKRKSDKSRLVKRLESDGSIESAVAVLMGE